MEKSESIEDFYNCKFDWIPEQIRKEIGHFNVFEHQPVESGKSRPLPYKRRDFYKVMFVKGYIVMDYADKSVEIKKQALFFSNPQIPYSCGNLEYITEGYYCIFDVDFFKNYGYLNYRMNKLKSL
jgi:AraC family transcriptional regulator, transcriptional activator of pobA